MEAFHLVMGGTLRCAIGLLKVTAVATAIFVAVIAIIVKSNN